MCSLLMISTSILRDKKDKVDKDEKQILSL